MKKLALMAALLCLLLTGCRAVAPLPMEEESAPPVVYAIVVKDVENPYMQRMFEGFAKACEELGAEAWLTGPEPDATQAETVSRLVDGHVAAIAIAANDPAEVSDALKKAMNAGIPVVSLDSMVYPGDRMVHIQQASPEMIGRVLIQAGTQMIGQGGEIAILTTTASMPNQSSWVKWMRHELEYYPDKYGQVTLVDTVYGLDEYDASAEQTRALLRDHPDLALIIAPTVVGLRAAAMEATAAGSSVKVTGLGLPSDMEPYINSGVCPWMYLWNPSEVGYLAAYAAEALVEGSLTGVEGEIVSAGSLGDKVVTPCEDGGTEIVLGNPKLFDATNITMWKEVF